jgi:hypothetical protein
VDRKEPRGLCPEPGAGTSSGGGLPSVTHLTH